MKMPVEKVTLLQGCFFGGHVAAARALIARGADINKREERYRSFQGHVQNDMQEAQISFRDSSWPF